MPENGDKCFGLNGNENETKSDISIAWRNLRYKVNEFSDWKWKKKCILRSLTGNFCTGSLNGLLGPSGAGKTTLLNCLSGSARSGLSKKSTIYLNSQQSKSTVSYYIRQHVHESIIGEFTIGQILQTAFAFKNGSKSEAEMRKHITSTMSALMLPPDLKSRPFDLCSGGEQKRVAIAQELMALNAPSFLFLDEPTTGLDSASAYETMFCLQKLAKNQNITIIASIHAPNDETLNLFDKLYVLAKGGVCIYSGPPKQINEQLRQKIDFTIPEEQPPIEALLKIACNGIQNHDVIQLATRTLPIENSVLNNDLPSLIATPNGLPTTRKCFSISNFLTQLMRQCRITFIAKVHFLLFTPVVLTLFYFILSTIFNTKMTHHPGCYLLEPFKINATCNSDDKLEIDDLVRENGHFLAYVIMVAGFTTLISCSIQLSMYVKVFQSEHRNYWYSLGVFYWSTNLITFIELTIQSICLIIITYFLSNQHAADNFTINWTRLGMYSFFIWLMNLYYQTLGQIIGIILVNHQTIAILFSMLFKASFMLFNGLFIKTHRMESAALVMIGRWSGSSDISKGIFYAIYGIDRCDEQKEYSWVLVDYDIQANQIATFALRLSIIVLTLKVLSFVIMYFKFSDFASNQKKTAPNVQMNEAIEFGFKLDEKHQINGKEDQLQVTKTETEFKKLSTNQIVIAWRNLCLSEGSSFFEMASKNTENGKLILRHLNGQFRFGTLNALMGTSGAGKTSLLRVLNGQCKTRLSDQTEIYLSKLTTIRTCFITQEVSAHLMPGLTAKQMLIYASKLKNGRKGVDHEMIALQWLKELDLLNTIDTKVDNCSGGEQKRLAVALELTSLEMPNLICIDEPTSGLDSNSAEIVISTLRKLTHTHPLTIITSIHQPTVEVLYMFDQLYVLARGGVCIYSGSPKCINTYLQQLPDITEHISKFPIETLISLACSGAQSQVIQKLVRQNDQVFSSEDQFELLDQTQLSSDGVLPNRLRFSFNSVLTLSQRFLLYIYGYLWKEWLFYFTILMAFAVNLRLIFPTKIINVSGCYLLEEVPDSCTKTAKDVEDELTLTDNLTYSYLYSNIYLLLILLSASFNFVKEFKYFANEHQNGWYTSGSFYLMKSFFEILFILPCNLLYVYIINIFDPVATSPLFWPIFSYITIACIAFIGLGHCLSLLSRGNIIIQTLLLCSIFILSLILNNFLIHIEDMHYIYQLLSHFSVHRYLFESLILMQFGFGRCQPKEIQTIMYSMSIEETDYYPNLVMLLFNLVLFRVIAVCLLIRGVNPIENRRKRITRIVEYSDKMQQSIEMAMKDEFRIWVTRP